jgi:hypothetical protein
MLVLKTTSPVFSPKNPKDHPSYTVPSSKANRALYVDFMRFDHSNPLKPLSLRGNQKGLLPP